MIERVMYLNVELAMIVRRDFQVDGISFLTDPDDGLQIGYMKRESGYKITPHRHQPVSRQVLTTQEVLFIKRGKVRVDFYSDEDAYLESRSLHAGDVIFLRKGGHGFEMLEESEIIEVKQGPYAGNKDKLQFDGHPKEAINCDA